MSLRRLAVLGLCFAQLAGCGGEDLGRPSAERTGVEQIDACRGSEGYEFKPIMDFEASGDDTRITCDAALGVSCSYYFNYDLAHSVLTPDELAARFPAGSGYDCLSQVSPEFAVSNPEAADGVFNSEPIDGGRCEQSTSGFHITARNIGMCYGTNGRLGWGASADVTFAPVLDASEWDGISFWVRRGKGSSGRAIILSLVDPYTSGAEDPETLEAYCNASDTVPGQTPVPDTAKCDAFGTAITLTDEWTFVPADFGALRQKGFGVRSPLGRVDAARLTRLQVLMTAGDWDVWIDDIALFRKPG